MLEKVPKKFVTKRQIKNKVVSDMKNLKVYKDEYEVIINVFVDLNDLYQRALAEFEDGGYEYETGTAAGGFKKSSLISTLETLRKDILAYSDRLCVNPKSIENITLNNEEKSKLAKLLEQSDR